MTRGDRDPFGLGLPPSLHGAPEVLRRRGTTADFAVYRVDGRLVGLKTVSGRGWLFRMLLGRHLIRRELAIIHRLQGVPGIPTLIGPANRDGMLLEYEPGVLFTEYTSESRMPDAFLDGLERTIAGMHARGVAHGDLSNRENILLGRGHRPVIFDFGTAALREAWLPPFSASLFRILADQDRRALTKYRLRHSGDPAWRTWRMRPNPLERWARLLKRFNLPHRIAKDRRKRSEIKEVIHRGQHRWLGRRGHRTRIRWERDPNG